MKPRRVILTLEVETSAPIKDLIVKFSGKYHVSTCNKKTGYWDSHHVRVLQAQANVVRASSEKAIRDAMRSDDRPLRALGRKWLKGSGWSKPANTRKAKR